MALNIWGKPENLGCKTAFDLIYNTPTRFNAVKSFRDILDEEDKKTEGYKLKIQNHPIILMDPKKPVGTDSMFKYNLLLCPKIPQKKTEVRKK